MPPDRRLDPPANFAERELPLASVGTAFVRIHRAEYEALHFGISGANRFHDPAGVYGVCYVAQTLEGAFAETCLRALGAQFVARSFLEIRSVSLIEVTAELRLVTAHGSDLSRLGITSAVSGGTYNLSQRWSRAIHDHPAMPDGILQRSNHDDGQLCAALFDRCRDRLRVGSATPLMSDRARLAELLDRYRVGLG